MKPSKKNKIHSWRLLDTQVLDGVESFRYQCSRSKCKAITFNGVPLPAPINEQCGVDKGEEVVVE